MRFQIPGALREFAGGRAQVEIEQPPETLDQALLALWALCPGMRDRVVTEQGQVRQHINIFVGDENIRYTGGLATKVPGDSVISIVPAVSGGGGETVSSSAVPQIQVSRMSVGTVPAPTSQVQRARPARI